jgi:hypothetical protein
VLCSVLTSLAYLRMFSCAWGMYSLHQQPTAPRAEKEGLCVSGLAPEMMYAGVCSQLSEQCSAVCGAAWLSRMGSLAAAVAAEVLRCCAVCS